MTEKEFNDLITLAGRKAIINMENNQDKIEEVKFSKRHEEQMKKIFQMIKAKI